MRRRAAVYAVVAMLGIAFAVAVTWGTSSLVRQHIGLAGEPLSVGAGLAAGEARAPASRRSRPPAGATAPVSPSGTRRGSGAPPATTPQSTAGATEAESRIAAAPQTHAPEPTSRSGADEGGSGQDD